MVFCVECLPADKPWDVVSVTRRSSGVAPRACVRVYARVLVPPNIYIHTYIRQAHTHRQRDLFIYQHTLYIAHSSLQLVNQRLHFFININSSTLCILIIIIIFICTHAYSELFKLELELYL